jgi:hypothetical protein
MKQDILERLLIDRALDALSPDVVVLLEAHLEKEPEQRHVSLEINESVRLAGMALPRRREILLPPLKVLPLPEKTAAGMCWRRAWWPAELAAAFVLGIGLAFWALHPGEPAVSTPEANVVVARHEVADSASSFWSMTRFASMGSKAASAQVPRLTWRSLVQNPQVND